MPSLTVNLADPDDVRRAHALLSGLLADRRAPRGARTQPIDVLQLPGRARAALVNGGIRTVGELTRLSVDELYGIPGVGTATGRAIETALHLAGAELARASRR